MEQNEKENDMPKFFMAASWRSIRMNQLEGLVHGHQRMMMQMTIEHGKSGNWYERERSTGLWDESSNCTDTAAKNGKINKDSNCAQRVGTWVNVLEMTNALACIFNEGKEMSEYRDSDEEGTWKIKVC